MSWFIHQLKKQILTYKYYLELLSSMYTIKVRLPGVREIHRNAVMGSLWPPAVFRPLSAVTLLSVGRDRSQMQISPFAPAPASRVSRRGWKAMAARHVSRLSTWVGSLFGLPRKIRHTRTPALWKQNESWSVRPKLTRRKNTQINFKLLPSAFYFLFVYFYHFILSSSKLYYSISMIFAFMYFISLENPRVSFQVSKLRREFIRSFGRFRNAFWKEHFSHAKSINLQMTDIL